MKKKMKDGDMVSKSRVEIIDKLGITTFSSLVIKIVNNFLWSEEKNQNSKSFLPARFFHIRVALRSSCI